MQQRIGILAYGSLINNPGCEIKEATVEILKAKITSPIKIEFARKSRTRGEAPTLVPVKAGGARVAAQILVLRDDISETEAANRLWRRETDSVCTKKVYTPQPKPNSNTVIIEKKKNFHGVGVVLFTRIDSNIKPLTAENLARLAIESVHKARKGRDGISYLIDAKKNGIKTPLSGPYEDAIKRQLHVGSLEEALKLLSDRNRT
jgi:hypothetical protein